MKVSAAEVPIIVGAIALAIVALYIAKKGVAGAAAGVVTAAGEAAVGTVYGIGDFLGIPRTNMTKCQKAIAEGRTWDASFACPATDFLGSLGGLFTAPLPTRLDNIDAAGNSAAGPVDHYDPMGQFLGNW